MVPTRAAAATCAATTWAEIQTCHDAAASGDTITLSGAITASGSAITVTKGVTIKGVSDCTTAVPAGAPSDWVTEVPTSSGCGAVITDNLAGSTVGFNITCEAAQTTRLAQFKVTPGTRTSGSSTYFFQVQCANTDTRRLRIDHIYFDAGVGFARLNDVIGLIDHNYVNWLMQAGMSYVKHLAWDGGANADKSMADTDGTNFGTVNFTFFEDNYITTRSAGNPTAIESEGGARFVVRYNVVQGTVGMHGTESGNRERSARALEFYNNHALASASGSGQNMLFIRGGVGLVYGNAEGSGYLGSSSIALSYNRAVRPFPPFGGSDGRNPWDINGTAAQITGSVDSQSSLTITPSTVVGAANLSGLAGYTIVKTGGTSVKSCASITRSGTTATATCAGHGFSNGNSQCIWGATPQDYNQCPTITVTGTDTFTYTLTADPGANATGTIKATVGPWYGDITSSTATSVTIRSNSLGSGNLTFTAGDTYEINKVTNGLDGIGRVIGSEVSGSSPTIPGGWNDQTTEPWYEWNNVKCTTATPTLSCTGTNTGFNVSSNGAGMIVSGTHYRSDTEYVYTPYTYPHPLATPPSTLAITTASLTGVVVGSAYLASVVASGGTGPYTFAISAGALPSGLSLSSDGTISGVTYAVGTASFTVQVTDGAAATDTQDLSITVTAATSSRRTRVRGLR